MTDFPWLSLPRPLATRDRRRLGEQLRALVSWQRGLRGWPAPGAAPDAQPFVSLYVAGDLRGCYGSDEGGGGERLARAFLLAAGDPRFAPIRGRERAGVAAQVSYFIRPRALDPEALVEEMEIGTHGVALVCRDGKRTAVLPDVARERGMTAARFLAAARAKIGLQDDVSPAGTKHFLFETEMVTSRGDDDGRGRDSVGLAVAWLARQVGRDGSIAFGANPHTGDALARGAMFHARCAAAIEALAAAGAARARVGAARAWLARELARALRGGRADAWPDAPAMVAGTLALAVRAGVDVRAPLLARARDRALAASPWHAAQVIAAVGAAVPNTTWRACVHDLDRNPVAPWTALAARALGDGAVSARCEAILVDAVRARAPHRGAVCGAAVPELALTAMVVTALRAFPSRAARAAVDRATAFLRRWQFAPGAVPAAIDPRVALGGFPLSPVHSALRTDVTAHALLALGADRASPAS